MELSKQEMELFLPLPGLWSKNFFYNILLKYTNIIYTYITAHFSGTSFAQNDLRSAQNDLRSA